MIASAENLVVGDERGRVLAVSTGAAEMLGWPAQELVGRRLTTIIPHRLREAHVAGVTRQLVTGRSRLLDQEILLPAMQRDGCEVTLRVRLSKEIEEDGAVVYLARLSRLIRRTTLHPGRSASGGYQPSAEAARSARSGSPAASAKARRAAVS